MTAENGNGHFAHPVTPERTDADKKIEDELKVRHDASVCRDVRARFDASRIAQELQRRVIGSLSRLLASSFGDVNPKLRAALMVRDRIPRRPPTARVDPS